VAAAEAFGDAAPEAARSALLLAADHAITAEVFRKLSVSFPPPVAGRVA
jgi:hypothetical protein